MKHNVKPATINYPDEAQYYEQLNNGFRLYESDKTLHFLSAFIDPQTGRPDPTTWAKLNVHLERNTPIFTKEYCQYQGITRNQYDTIQIIH